MKKRFIIILIAFLLIIPISIKAAVKEGFITENGYTYLYKNGVLQKGITEYNGEYYFLGEYSGKVQKGLVTSSLTGKTYYTDNSGKLQSGFIIIKGYTYYFNNDLKYGITRINGEDYFLGEYSGKVQKGLVTSSLTGKTYYTDNSGKLQSGFITIKGYTYYFNKDLKYGITNINGEDYFLGEYSGKVQKGFITSSLTGKKYYADSTGKIKTGFIDINGYTYYFNKELKYGITRINGEDYFLGEYSGKVQKGLITSSLTGKKYYADNTGKLQSGFIAIKGYTYYFNKDLKYGITKIDGEYYFLGEYSGKVQTGLVTSSLTGKKYLADNTGKLKKGKQKVNSKMMYFSKTTCEALTGFIKETDTISFYADKDYYLVTGEKTINKTKYRFTNEGTLYHGFVVFGEDKYYFVNGYKQTGITRINGEDYFLGEYSGKVQVGKVVSSITGDVYYTDENGKIKKGITLIDGYYYFLGEYSGKVQRGLIKSSINGNYYYADDEGKIYTGEFVINDVTYSADQYGVLKNGFKDEDGDKYYYIKGVKIKGPYEVNGNLYFFGEVTGKLQYGWITSAYTGDRYYANANGILLKGIQKLDDILYYFGEVSGKLQYGWITSTAGHIYYANEEGIILTGEQVIDGETYKFKANGMVESGFVTINGATYYIDANGNKLKGLQRIHGVRYRFDSDGKMTDSNFKLIADISYYQGTIDWDALWASKDIDGVILRVGYSGVLDEKFEEYLDNVKRLNIPYSIYLFSYAHDASEALYEAYFTIDQIKKYKLNLDMPVYYDIEGWKLLNGTQSSNDISKQTYQEIIENYIWALNAHSYEAKVYTGWYYARDRLTAESRKHVDWIAHYTSNSCGYTEPHTGWQFTSTGRVTGIKGDVDLSIFY